eukprot:7394648-Lingulodinium_polyedra.AAC.1
MPAEPRRGGGGSATTLAAVLGPGLGPLPSALPPRGPRPLLRRRERQMKRIDPCNSQTTLAHLFTWV